MKRHKKNVSLSLAILLLIGALSACSSESTTEATETTTVEESAEAAEAAESVEEALEDSDEAADSLDEEETISDEDDTEASENELLELAISFEGKPLSELIEAIGEPNASDYASSCIGSGEDGNLYYDGFTVYTYREGDDEVVSYVE